MNRETTSEAELTRRQKRLESERRYREKNRDKIREHARKHYRKHRERILEGRRGKPQKRKRPETPEQIAVARERVKRYQKRHPDRLRERQRNRIKNDPVFAFKRLLRSRVSTAVRSQYVTKAFKTMDLIGCSVPNLLKHLESGFLPGMTWDNYGRHGWHIDHIIPCAVFDLSVPSQQKRCFHYTNLRPAWSKDNVGRGSRIEGELPLVYLRRGRKASSLTRMQVREPAIL